MHKIKQIHYSIGKKSSQLKIFTLTPWAALATNISCVINFGNIHHLNTTYTLLILLERLTLLALTICLSTLFYYDCLGHQEFENIAHDGLRVFIEVVWSDGTGRDRYYLLDCYNY